MPTVSNEIPNAESPGKKENPWEEAATKISMALGLAEMAAGFEADSSGAKSAAFATLAFNSGQKSLKAYKEGNYHEATVHGLTAIGTGLRSVGMAADNPILNATGPALNSITQLASAGITFLQGKDGWEVKTVEAAEMASFSIGAGLGMHRAPMSLGWGLTAVAFGMESKGDKGFLGHALGALTVATGWAIQTNSVKSLGAAVISTAEFLRLGYQFRPQVPQTPLFEAAPHPPHIGQFLPSNNSAHGTGSRDPHGDSFGGNLVAQAANNFTLLTSSSDTKVAGVTSTPPFGGVVGPPEAARPRRHSV